jgi:hypothetical protein
MLAILFKEVATGMMIGYVVGGLGTAREESRKDARRGSEKPAGRLIAKPMVLVAGVIGLLIAAVLSIFPLHDWSARNAARENLRRRALGMYVVATDINEARPGDRYVLSPQVIPQTRVLASESYEEWLPPAHRRYFLLEVTNPPGLPVRRDPPRDAPSHEP